MINIQVSRDDLICIIGSMSPRPEVMRHPLMKGSVDGSYGRWSWDVDFSELADGELVTMLALLTGG